MGLSGQFSKHDFVVVNHPLDVGLCSIAKGAISVSKEVTSKVVLGLFNILQLVVPWRGLQLLIKLTWVLQGREYVINPDHNIFITVSSISDPNIWVCKGWNKSQLVQGGSKLGMPSAAT